MTPPEIKALQQRIFNTVRDHLLAQGTTSAEETESGSMRCLYRGPNGTKCAAGALITDEFYLPSLEDWSIDNSAPLRALGNSLGVSPDDMKAGFPHGTLLLVKRLQRIHDDAVNSVNGVTVATWPDHLTDLAEEFGLEP